VDSSERQQIQRGRVDHAQSSLIHPTSPNTPPPNNFTSVENKLPQIPNLENFSRFDLKIISEIVALYRQQFHHHVFDKSLSSQTIAISNLAKSKQSFWCAQTIVTYLQERLASGETQARWDSATMIRNHSAGKGSRQ
jgi:hypothetical protein